MLERLLAFFKLISELNFSNDTMKSRSIQESQFCALTNSLKIILEVLQQNILIEFAIFTPKLKSFF